VNHLYVKGNSRQTSSSLLPVNVTGKAFYA